MLEEKKVQVLEKVLKQIWRLRQQFRGKVSWLLLQDNISAHVCHDSKVLSGLWRLSGDQDPPYSADLAPTEFFLNKNHCQRKRSSRRRAHQERNHRIKVQ